MGRFFASLVVVFVSLGGAGPVAAASVAELSAVLVEVDTSDEAAMFAARALDVGLSPEQVAHSFGRAMAERENGQALHVAFGNLVAGQNWDRERLQAALETGLRAKVMLSDHRGRLNGPWGGSGGSDGGRNE